MPSPSPAIAPEAENSYDQLPYPGNPFAQTHPIRLATVATLFGMRPAPVDRCRVLELGCADGGNLIPLAAALPHSEFVGVDLSGRQVQSGRETIAGMSLGNIRLEQRDISDVGPEYGEFDYIISHGVYSWVPDSVQERILAIARERLRPQGVAYISYNTYPGWHMRGMLRDMMLYHTRQFADVQTRIDQARALVNFLADAVPSRENPYGLLLSGELGSMRTWSDTYIFHELLEVHNQPIYFHQFVERAARHGLRFLGEANFGTMLTGDLSSAVTATLHEIGRGIVEMEQYMDFVRNRMFRQSLLCHAGTSLDRTLTSACCANMHLRSRLQPVSGDLDPLQEGEAEFRSPGGAIVSAKTPFQKAALLALTQSYPRPVHFSELVRRARVMAQRQAMEVHETRALESEEEDLRDAVFRCFCESLIDLHVFPTACAVNPAERPVASVVARWQARPGGYVTNLFHEQVALDVVNAHLVRLLDGTRDRSALLESLVELAAQGTIVATKNGEVIEDQSAVAEVLGGQLESRLCELARMGVLLESATPSGVATDAA
jgi:methyltransferase-like protein/trans-aconitate methyltransferase